MLIFVCFAIKERVEPCIEPCTDFPFLRSNNDTEQSIGVGAYADMYICCSYMKENKTKTKQFFS